VVGGSLCFGERARIGEDHRAQVSVGDGAVIVADTGSNRQPPDAAAVTHSVTVRVADVRLKFELAEQQGAAIVMAPTEFPFGECQCTVQESVVPSMDLVGNDPGRRT
jgi:uncharacterized glyoxalase superfamily protein PhnB